MILILILMAGPIGKETDFSIRHNVYSLQICSSIPTVLFRCFFHLEIASLKTSPTSVLISLGQLLSFNFNLKAGVKISTH